MTWPLAPAASSGHSIPGSTRSARTRCKAGDVGAGGSRALLPGRSPRWPCRIALSGSLPRPTVGTPSSHGSSGGLQNPLHDPFSGELGAGLLHPGRGRGGAAGPRVSPARPGSATGLKGPRHHWGGRGQRWTKGGRFWPGAARSFRRFTEGSGFHRHGRGAAKITLNLRRVAVSDKPSLRLAF